MTKDTHVVDSYENAHFLQFSLDPLGDEMARYLSRITINWGKLEQTLYLSLKSIDGERAAEWRDTFFSSPALAERRKQARKSMISAVESSYPKLLEFFEEALDDLQDIQHRRNALSHGLWLPVEKIGEYPVQPLRYDKKMESFGPILIVDLKFLEVLLEDMTRFTHRVFAIGSELLAHEQLKKWGMR